MTRSRLPAPALPAWITRELPFTRYVVEVDGRPMHVMEAGEGRPVLMLHGNPTWGFLYRKVAAALQTDGYRLIAPDLIGLGFSHKPRDPAVHTLDNHARWVAGLIRRLELRDLILCVQDWGGAIGACAMAHHPGALAGLVVLNTVLSPPRPGFRSTTFHRFARIPIVSDVAFRWLGFPQVALAIAQGDRRSIRGATARAYRYPLRRFRDKVAPLALARMVPDSLEHASIPQLTRCREIVESFDGPAAIVWGDRDPVLGRARNWIQKLIPQARVTRTEAGHFLQEEVPEEIADGIRYVAAQL